MSLEEIEACPVCNNTLFTQQLISKDHTTTGELFHVKQCTNCKLGITSPRPFADNSSRYYHSGTYISHTISSKGIFDTIYLIIRQFTLKWKLSLIKPYLTEGPLLDYGCGTGSFLEKAQKKKITGYGVEPSDEARKKIHPGIRVAESLDSFQNIQFEMITLWHVLEHVYALRETLQQLKSRLLDRGTIFIAVPNWESYDAQHYRELWAAYDTPRHLWHFSKESMAMLLNNEGLVIRQIIPMKLDAYYVSLLSEKNANSGRLSFLRCIHALAVAFRSNARGKKEKNQSSLIFVVQK